ncbi:MAG: hypothetical protein GY805_22610 [Chloroflexi bacterium]|nr:hypothetical protein [Chloroflexota bacterium]
MLVNGRFPSHSLPSHPPFHYNVLMSGDLLQTKLYVPKLRPFPIPRPHLIKQLNQGLQQGCKLTLRQQPSPLWLALVKSY